MLLTKNLKYEFSGAGREVWGRVVGMFWKYCLAINCDVIAFMRTVKILHTAINIASLLREVALLWSARFLALPIFYRSTVESDEKSRYGTHTLWKYCLVIAHFLFFTEALSFLRSIRMSPRIISPDDGCYLLKIWSVNSVLLWVEPCLALSTYVENVDGASLWYMSVHVRMVLPTP